MQDSTEREQQEDIMVDSIRIVDDGTKGRIQASIATNLRKGREGNYPTHISNWSSGSEKKVM